MILNVFNQSAAFPRSKRIEGVIRLQAAWPLPLWIAIDTMTTLPGYKGGPCEVRERARAVSLGIQVCAGDIHTTLIERWGLPRPAPHLPWSCSEEAL